MKFKSACCGEEILKGEEGGICFNYCSKCNYPCVIQFPSGFRASEELNSVNEAIKSCDKCNEAIKTRELGRPFIGYGSPNAKVMFIGERPGFQDNKTGVVFTGNRSGRKFCEMLLKAKIDFASVYTTNIVKCQTAGNRKPDEEETLNCCSYLWKEIEIISPKLIVCLGTVPFNFFFDDKGSYKYRNKIFEEEVLPGKKFKFLLVYHPAYICRTGSKHEEEYLKIFKTIKKYI